MPVLCFPVPLPSFEGAGLNLTLILTPTLTCSAARRTVVFSSLCFASVSACVLSRLLRVDTSARKDRSEESWDRTFAASCRSCSWCSRARPPQLPLPTRRGPTLMWKRGGVRSVLSYTGPLEGRRSSGRTCVSGLHMRATRKSLRFVPQAMRVPVAISSRRVLNSGGRALGCIANTQSL